MLRCPACSNPIPKDAIRPARLVAACPHCDALVRLQAAGNSFESVGFTPSRPPKGIEVAVDEAPVRKTRGYRDAIAEPGRFRASRRWWTPAVLFMTVFVLFWDGFLVLWYSFAFGDFGSMGGMGLIMILFPLIHVTVGVGMTYWVLATWVNRTTIEVARGELRSRHGPIPWPFGKTQPIALDAVELFETERVNPRINNKGNRQTWQVVARTGDGRRVPVVTRLSDERQATYLARRLDAQLG